VFIQEWSEVQLEAEDPAVSYLRLKSELECLVNQEPVHCEQILALFRSLLHPQTGFTVPSPSQIKLVLSAA
jgi:hypothetical protein